MLTKLLNGFLLLFVVFAACKTARVTYNNAYRNAEPQSGSVMNLLKKPQPVSTSFRDADTNAVFISSLNEASKPRSLEEIRQAPDGSYLLTPGYYQGDFRSFCLHPGTHGPSDGDGYLYAPLKGSRKDIVESILRNSVTHTDITQRDVQLLLWAVISNSNFKQLSNSLKTVAAELLTPAQLYHLNGGAIG